MRSAVAGRGEGARNAADASNDRARVASFTRSTAVVLQPISPLPARPYYMANMLSRVGRAFRPAVRYENEVRHIPRPIRCPTRSLAVFCLPHLLPSLSHSGVYLCRLGCRRKTCAYAALERPFSASFVAAPTTCLFPFVHLRTTIFTVAFLQFNCKLSG